MVERDEVARMAGQVGFHVVRFTRVRRTPHIEDFDRWLMRGHHADQHWLVRTRDTRLDPRARAPWAKTAMVLAVHHHHQVPADPGGRTGRVARYAWGRDYHNLVGKRLKRLREQLAAIGVRGWGGVDTAPILERDWAQAAGLGFAGRNTLQIRPAQGSWFFLGVLFLDVDLVPDAPIARDHCGRCTRCLTACPTQAFVGPRTLDSARCISYWTIEAKGLPPSELRAGFGRWLFGCDDCQEVCPHNHAPPEPDEDDLLPRHAWVDLDALLLTSDADLKARFAGTPLARPGPDGLKRNAALVLGNLGDTGAVPALRAGSAHPNPVVRAAAAWSLMRLGERPPLDDHPLVQAERNRT